MARQRFLAPLLLAAACSSDTQIDLENVGRACVVPEDTMLAPEDDPGAIMVDYGAGSLVVDAVVDTCASACARDIDVGCAATLSGDTLEIETWAHYSYPDGSCDASCRVLQAQCEVPALEPGTYTVAMGATTGTLVIPGTAPIVCVEQFSG